MSPSESRSLRTRLICAVLHHDPAQRIRIIRTLMSVFAWSVTLGLFYVFYVFGMAKREAVVVFVIGLIGFNSLFYAMIRFDWNLRFKDPSLTLLQLVAVNIISIPAAHFLNAEARGISSVFFILGFAFGVFKLKFKEMLTLAAALVASVSAEVMWTVRQGDLSLSFAIPYCLTLATALPLFSAFGAYFSQLRSQMRKAKVAAEAASQTKGEFLALMSHELRTPMSGIIGMLNLALREQLTPAARERLELAAQNANSLLHILNDLLDVSKIDAGKLQVERIDFDLRVDLHHALALLSERARDKSIAFDVTFDEALPRYVVGDPTRVRQVLLNLAGNALKFTSSGGVHIKVELARKEGDTCWVHFEVKDTGIGIPQDALSRLFQQFEQADSSTTRRFGGTGLGLSITKQLVELMGGSVGVRSTEGLGSIFYFDLPLQEGQAPQLAPVDVSTPHPYTLRILCAEDVYTNQVIIKSLLEDMGHECDLVENGEAALEALSRGDYDLVLMDGRMPVMDGLRATRHLREGHYGSLIFPHKTVRVVALTANASEQDRRKCLEAGMDDFLPKPISEVALHRTLSQAIDACLMAGRRLTPRGQAQDVAQAVSNLDALLGLSPEAGEPPASAAMPVGPVGHAEPQAKPHPPAAGKVPLKQRLQEAFRSDAPGRLAELESALEAGDWSQAAIVAHGFKGSIAYIWPDHPVVELCANMEKWADAGERERLSKGVQELRAAVESLMASAAIA